MTEPTGGGASAFGVGEAGPHREPRPIGQLHEQRAEPALVPAGPFEVLQHPRFGVVEVLDLQQRQRPADFVARFRLAEHQPFAAERLDPRQLGAEVVQAGANRVLVGCQVRRPVPLDVCADGRETTLERGVDTGRVERDVADLLPQVGLVLPADDPDRALKGLATDPQLAVEGDLGQAFEEPVGGVKAVAQPGNQ